MRSDISDLAPTKAPHTNFILQKWTLNPQNNKEALLKMRASHFPCLQTLDNLPVAGGRRS
jgi:hypothetical protein